MTLQDALDQLSKLPAKERQKRLVDVHDGRSIVKVATHPSRWPLDTDCIALFLQRQLSQPTERTHE